MQRMDEARPPRHNRSFLLRRLRRRHLLQCLQPLGRLSHKPRYWNADDFQPEHVGRLPVYLECGRDDYQGECERV